MSVCRYIHAFAPAPFEANVGRPLIDVVSLTPVVLSEGTFVDSAHWKRDATLTAGATFAIGWEGAPSALGDGVTTSALIAGNIAYNAMGVQSAPTADVGLIVTATSVVDVGSVEVLVRCASYLE